ncbi:conserved oligomeric Golgi complex subunit 1 isoform X2 [Arctopsyche grandis]|uniref:conserved oligomeric Golgi complex subunit 1 isoform X2 n=1 Tax=Arctopsyche grandis TaxID=121162 RepID=UPI00406D9491
MPDSNLLNINPDVLFQQHWITEIDDIQKKLLLEIERKKEELRIMVGEKYRDLIEAADTIGEMKSTVNNCIQNIDDMTSTCQKLHDTYLIGFKNNTNSTSVERPVVNRTTHGIAIQIKLLMEIPEQIWSNVDVEDFLTATQLFLLARHIYTGLQLETGGQNANKNISALMPVVHRQWNSLSNFNECLIKACHNKLENFDIKPEVAASCLASLYLLDRNKSLVDLMKTFITLHSTNSLSTILNKSVESSISAGNIKDDIKDRICACVKVIIRTLELLYSCFVENEDGLILQKLNNLYKKDSPPLIALVQCHDSSGFKLLPSVIADYRLTPAAPLKAVNKEELFQCVSTWMKWVQQFSSERVESFLKYINSAKSLHLIRENALAIEIPNNWSDICKALTIDQQYSNIWTSQFQPLVTKRVKDAISSKWEQITKTFKDNFNKLLESVLNPNSKEKEVNLNWFVWNDLISESFIDADDDIIIAVNDIMKGMAMQDRGFTPKLENVCINFNSGLQSLLEDLQIYLYGTSASNANQSDFEEDVKHVLSEKPVKDYGQIKLFCDRADVENFLHEVSKKQIKSIIEYIHDDCLKKSKENTTSDLPFNRSILTSRLLQAIPQLVPNLRSCFVPLQVQSILLYEEFQIPDADNTALWDEVCKILDENCHLCWTHWVDNAIKKIEELLLDMPQEFTMAANINYLLVQWDAITIEEKDDQDQPISSTIKIPAGPSIKLQEFIYLASRILDEVVPHTLPKKIHSNFIETVADKTLKYFSRVIKDKSDEINQKCALQLMMDVRHLTLLLVTRENKKLLSDSHEICDLLKEKIDPFDYDVFYPHMQVNAKRSVQRVQTLFGSMIPNHDQLNSIIGPKPLTSGGTSDRDPNAFILASQGNSSIAWFPLLPVTAPLSSIRKQNEKQLQYEDPFGI